MLDNVVLGAVAGDLVATALAIKREVTVESHGMGKVVAVTVDETVIVAVKLEWLVAGGAG